MSRNSSSDSIRAFLVQQSAADKDPSCQATWTNIPLDELDSGDVLIRVSHSALNYKDALAVGGHRGVARKLPLVPGIDAVGTVIESSGNQFSPGQQVLVAHADFGTAHHGGFASLVRVPAEYVYLRPESMTNLETVAWGTAGFTAAQSVEALLAHGVTPDAGPVVVTGATGGVGVFSVMILAQLGFDVVASSGKEDRRDWLQQLGAARVVDRAEFDVDSSAPLLKGEFAGAIDTVGGSTLATVLRRIKNHGCVTACGLVAGDQVQTTVYPFILRGVTLCGIDSANIDRATRAALWQKIGSQWRLPMLDEMIECIAPDQLAEAVTRIAAGKVAGRVVLQFDEA